MPAKQLERELKGKTPIKKPRCVLMYFAKPQYKELEAALEKYGGTVTRRGIQNREEALIRMIRAMNKQSEV
jgi:hypothetical protein